MGVNYARGRGQQNQTQCSCKNKSGQSASAYHKVQVSVPSASSTNKLVSLQDVDATTLEDGALLQYDAAETNL